MKLVLSKYKAISFPMGGDKIFFRRIFSTKERTPPYLYKRQSGRQEVGFSFTQSCFRKLYFGHFIGQHIFLQWGEANIISKRVGCPFTRTVSKMLSLVSSLRQVFRIKGCWKAGNSRAPIPVAMKRKTKNEICHPHWCCGN